MPIPEGFALDNKSDSARIVVPEGFTIDTDGGMSQSGRMFLTPSQGSQQDVMGTASPKDKKAAESAKVFVKNDIPAIAKTYGAKIGGGMEQSLGGVMQAYGERNTNSFNVGNEELAQTRAGRDLIQMVDADTKQRAGIAQRGMNLGNEGRAVIQAAQEDHPVQTRAGKILDQTVQSIGSNLPGMATTLVTGNPAPGLAAMGLQSFGQTYDESRARGLSIDDATTNAAIQGGTEVATELLPFVSLSKYLKSGNLSKEVLKTYLSDIPGEHLATMVQNSSDAAYAKPNMTRQQRIDAAADYLVSNQHKQDQIDTFFTTILQDALMTGVAKAARVGSTVPASQPHTAPAPVVDPNDGALSRAVSRAAAPVASIGGLVAERRGMAGPATMSAQDMAAPAPYKPNFTMQGKVADHVTPEVIPPVAPLAIGHNPQVIDTTASDVAVTPEVSYPGVMVEPQKLLPQPVIDTTASDITTRSKPAPMPLASLIAASRNRAATMPANDGIAITKGGDVSEGNQNAAEGNQNADAHAAEGGQEGKLLTAPVGADTAPAEVAPQPLTPLDANAHEAAASPLNGKPEPTPAQTEAGNYAKGHINLHGLDISVENPDGSTRKGVDASGKPWETTMNGHYGYVKGTVGADKDHVDVFVKAGIDQTTAGDKTHVIDQIDPKTGKLDEHKVMLGYATADEAKAAYLSNYDKTGKDRIGAITETSVDDFKSWLKNGDTGKAFAPSPPKVETAPKVEAAAPASTPAPDATRSVLATLAKPKKRSDASIANLSAKYGKDTVNALVKAGHISFPGAGMAALTKKGRAALEKMPAPLSKVETTQLANLAKNKKRNAAQEANYQQLQARSEQTSPPVDQPPPVAATPAPVPPREQGAFSRSKVNSLKALRAEISQGEAGKRFISHDVDAIGTGGDVSVTSSGSTFPDYFQNKGYTKKESLNIIGKAIDGKFLTEKQRAVLDDLMEGVRREQTARILANRKAVAAMPEHLRNAHDSIIDAIANDDTISKADTSFDFGYNVEGYDETRNEESDKGGTRTVDASRAGEGDGTSQADLEATDDAAGWKQEVAVKGEKKQLTIGGEQKQGGKRVDTSTLMDGFTPEPASLFDTPLSPPKSSLDLGDTRAPVALTLELVQSAFPRQQITEKDGVFTVTTPSGVTIRISKVGHIEFDRAAAEAAYGRKILPNEKPVAEFRALPQGSIINLTERGVSELPHEVFHGGFTLALNDRQRAAILKSFGTEEKAAAEYQRLKDDGSFDNGKGHLFLRAIYNFFRNLRQLVAPTARGVMEDVASGKVWDKAVQRGEGAKYSIFRKVDRASESMSAEQKAAVEAAFGTPMTAMERAKEFKKNIGRNLTQGILDQYAPIKEVDTAAYMKARMTKGSDSTLEAVMLYGKPYIDSTGSIKVEFDSANKAMNGFASILSRLDGEHDRFLKWVAGTRAARLKDIGLENLMSVETIAALKTLNQDGTADNKLANGQNRAFAYSRALHEMNAYNDAILKVAVERGLLNDATRQMYKDMPYIPFYRLQDEGVVSGFTTTSGLVNQTAWKKLKGGTNKLNDDMLANMLKNWSHLITASARNDAAKSTLTKAMELGAAQEVPAGYPGKGVVSFRENTDTVLKKQPDGSYKRVKGDPIPAGTKYKENGVSKVSDGTVVPEFNVERHFIVSDPHLLDAITSIGQTVQVPKFIRGFKNILTMSVTANPTFKIRNLIRDSIASIALADLSYNPAANIKKGFAATAQDSEVRAQMLAAGGLMRFGSMLDGASADNARKLIDSGVPASHILDTPGKISAMWEKYVVGAFDAYQEFGDRSEQINRAALYKSLLEKGYTADEAAFWARDLMDFSMSGKWAGVRFLTQTVPFMNARLQGLYKLGRAGKADKKRFAYVIGGVTMASLALLGAYGDDDDWKKREDWDRDNYWWFKVGSNAFRIPKPFEIGAIGTFAEITAEVMFNKEMTGKRFAGRLRDIVSQQLSMNPTPQIVKPMIDLWANKDAFTNRPIEGMGMDRLKPEDRANDRTSGTAKLLGQLGMPNPAQAMMGRYDALSPLQIDSLIRGYFSWVGMASTVMLDYGIFKPLSGKTMPAPQLKDVFLIGNFAETLPSNSSRYVTQMYEAAKDIEQSYNSYHNALKTGDKARAAAIMASDREKLQKHGQIEGLKQASANINQKIRKITDSPYYSAEKKRTMIDNLKQRQDAIARRLTP